MSVPLEPRNPHLHWSSGSHFFYILFLYLSCVLIGLNYTGWFTIHLSPYCIYHIYSVFHVLLYPLSCEFVYRLCFLTVVQFNILILHARIRSHLISCMLSNWTEMFLCGWVSVCVNILIFKTYFYFGACVIVPTAWFFLCVWERKSVVYHIPTT